MMASRLILRRKFIVDYLTVTYRSIQSFQILGHESTFQNLHSRALHSYSKSILQARRSMSTWKEITELENDPELISLVEAKEYLEKLNPIMPFSYIENLVTKIGQFHLSGHSHGDLQPACIFLRRNIPDVLIGVTKYPVTSKQYRAPEWVEGMLPTQEADIWCLSEILNSGAFLIKAKNQELFDLIDRGKTEDPKSRLTFNQLKKHPFLWSTEKRKYYFSIIGSLIKATDVLYKTGDRKTKAEKLLKLPTVDRQYVLSDLLDNSSVKLRNTFPRQTLQIPKTLQNFIGGYYDFSKYSDCFMAMRNLQEHAFEMDLCNKQNIRLYNILAALMKTAHYSYPSIGDARGPEVDLHMMIQLYIKIACSQLILETRKIVKNWVQNVESAKNCKVKLNGAIISTLESFWEDEHI